MNKLSFRSLFPNTNEHTVPDFKVFDYDDIVPQEWVIFYLHGVKGVNKLCEGHILNVHQHLCSKLIACSKLAGNVVF